MPTTDRPITSPPRKATFSALLMPARAAFAVLELALTATLMPTKPATVEESAPPIKATDACHPPRDEANKSKTAITATNIQIVVYCLFK